MSKNIGAKPIDLRRQNYQSIIQLFRNHPTLAVRDIAQVLSITANTDTNIREAMAGILNIADRLERRK